MAYSPLTGLIDPFCGKKDLENGIIRAVGTPEKRFGEDALRILRAFRFASQLGFDIDKSTLDGAFACRTGLEKIARERIGAEFQKLVTGINPCKAIGLMKKYEILPYILGDFSPDDAIINTLERIRNDFPLRMGALLSGEGREAASNILQNLKYSKKIISGSLAASEGLKFLASARVSRDKDARSFVNRYGESAKSIAEAAKVLGFINEETAGLIFRNVYCDWRISDLAVSGVDLICAGLSGAEIGKALEGLLEAVMENPAINNRDALLALARNFKISD